MSGKPISLLRVCMIQVMSVRNFVEKTKNDYIRHVKTFTVFVGRSPDRATPEDLRCFQVHQTDTGVRPPTINGSVAAFEGQPITCLEHLDARPSAIAGRVDQPASLSHHLTKAGAHVR